MKETIHMVLRVLTPVFVGCGQKLLKKEYIYIPNENHVYVPDRDRFFSWLQERNLVDAYTDFILSSDNSLYQWLLSQKASKEEIRGLAAYTAHGGDRTINGKPIRLDDIHSMVKGPGGKPYLPGSSIKGAMRTALLNKMVAGKKPCPFPEDAFHKGVQEMDARVKSGKEPHGRASKSLFRREAGNIEEGQFHKLRLVNQKGKEIPSYNAVCSAMRGLSVSDSLPVDASCLTLCQKLDVGPGGGISSRVPMIRECLKPGTELHAALTLDGCFLREAGMDRQFLVEAIQEFYALQNRQFVAKFHGFEHEAEERGCVLYLGGGCGFPSKTILQSLYGDAALSCTAELLTFLFPDGYHETDVAAGVSPHMLKCTKWEDRLVPLGKCEVLFP